MNVICAGCTFYLVETGAPHLKPHLWLVLTDPDGNPRQVVAVMVRTANEHTDPTLILRPGDHPFIERDSSVHYSTARCFRVDRIIVAMQRNLCSLREHMADDLLRRVREALKVSPYTTQVIRTYCDGRF